MITYDKNGLCTKCRLPGSGFVEDGVCECGDREERPLKPWLRRSLEAYCKGRQ